MKTKVLVLGSTGLIGHQVYNFLVQNSVYEVLNISYRKKLNEESFLCDVRNEKEFLKTLENMKPDIIVNCIGILIEGAEQDPENAIFVNAYMPQRLMRFCNENNMKLIHISTDCVFSGKKSEPYIETDEKDGQGIYAKTKGLGEIINEKHLTLRTSVVGPELKSNGEELFHWFMMQEGTIKGFKKAIWSGVTTLELAKAVQWAIENNITGLYHITNNQTINKFELLSLFKKYTKKDIEIIGIDGRETNKSFIDTRREINYKVPEYEVMIKDMVELIKNKPSMYKQYIGCINE